MGHEANRIPVFLTVAVFAAGLAVSCGSPPRAKPTPAFPQPGPLVSRPNPPGSNSLPAFVRLSDGEKEALLSRFTYDRLNPVDLTGKPPVFAVFYDVDGDWRTDAFVSSASERLASGENVWWLYRNGTNGWESVSQTFSDGRVALPTVLLAGTNDFICYRQHWNGRAALRIFPGYDPRNARAQIGWNPEVNRPVHLPVEELRERGVDDPSLVPLPGRADEEDSSRPFRERTRVLVDLNRDGQEDLLLSEPCEPEWETSVYFRRGDKFHRVGIIDVDINGGFKLERDDGPSEFGESFTARIWDYWRSGGSEGSIGYYRLGERAISPFHRLEIFPGDGGNAIGNGIIKAVFESPSDLPFRIQHSETSPDGVVTWKE